MATIKDVAKLSGFSVTTVSRVLNNDSTLSVSDETREKIYQAADQLNYRKKTVRPHIKNIAFLYWLTDKEELEDVYFKTIRLEIEQFAKKYNVDLHVYKINQGIEVIPKDIEGFIAVGAFSSRELNYLKELTPYGVFIDSSPEPGYYDSVRPDLNYITESALDYFIHHGHTEIGFIGGTYHNPDSDQEELDIREKRFRSYLQEKNLLNEDYIFVHRGFQVENGYNLMKKAINKLGENLPTAFFIAADPIAVGSLQALNESGISIPKRVSIISINNISIAKYVSPPLTTFHIDIKEICKSAIELLLEQKTNKRKVVKTLYIGSELILRKST
ncbi:LacI family DNA-binding transcriptional regulator [Bacillus andreraoultii]|uniref:LacI family DNA-binding transcriptional regulator n=1 Tax=Bacillus andreraoultii TaxID=1499685 RepID=UPI00053A56E1|nr:LacI family DNA-binding transcriptional regulator [Bacillus andreraoultii]